MLSRRLFLLSTATLATAATAQARPARGDSLRANFAAPPDSAKPRVWWHWMNGNVTREGIAKDFAWMKRVGIGGVQNFDAALSTPQVVERRLAYMTPEWQEAFRYAVRRADALDLEFAIASSPGWSETGGPWVEPKDGMKKLVWSETIVAGGRRFNGVLAAPPSATGPYQAIVGSEELFLRPEQHAVAPTYYADVAVLAYPVQPPPALPPPRAASANGEAIDAALLFDGNPATGIPLPASRDGAPGAVRFDYARAQTICSASVFVSNISQFSVLGAIAARLEASDDGRAWRAIADIRLTTSPTTVSFAPVAARNFRLVFVAPPPMDTSFFAPAAGVDMAALLASFGQSAPVQQLVQFQLFPEARVNAAEAKAGFSIAENYFTLDQNVGGDVAGVAPEAVIDISAHMTQGGHLDWTPPAGRWKILRLGYSLTGKTNHPATAEATGLEVDKYDAAAVEAYCNKYLDMYREAAGADMMGARGIRALLTDSIEVGPSNWTPLMLENFQRLRSYDAKPWLPALTGEIVDSRAQSDAFLYDFRRTLAELLATEHYGVVAKVAHERGLVVYGKLLEGTRATLGDDLDMRGFADIPMSALWSYARAPRANYIADGRGAASVAHLHGRTLVACESLTSIMQPHAYAPRDLQPMIDAIFANGVNRPVIHTSVHQPLDQGPGFSLQIFGQYFTRLESWAELAKPWVDYMSRNSYLLQQGRNVADVAYFYGEEAPIGAQAATAYLTDVPLRYAYDFVSADAVLNLLSVDGGDLISRGGARYKLIYLNAASARMSLPVLRRLAAFAEAGATIVGDAPLSSPSLKDDAAEFARLAGRLWGGGAVTRVGQGRVIAGRDVEAALTQIGIAPAFSHGAQAEMQFVHRKIDGGELYFVTNPSAEPVRTDARFRVAGKAPELWHADTGSAEAASYRIEGAETIVPLDLRAHQSVFVVFRGETAVMSATVARPAFRQVAEISGAWDVAFQQGRGAPASARLEMLTSLSEHSEPGIKYFSGEATYTKTIEAPEGARRGDVLLLDLGAIGDIAEVRVNGRLAGTAWKAPYRVDIGPYIRSGRNRLEIRVANLWVNRLIGDQQPGAEKITVTTVPTFGANAPLRPAGLLGPVTLWSAES